MEGDEGTGSMSITKQQASLFEEQFDSLVDGRNREATEIYKRAARNRRVAEAVSELAYADALFDAGSRIQLIGQALGIAAFCIFAYVWFVRTNARIAKLELLVVQDNPDESSTSARA